MWGPVSRLLYHVSSQHGSPKFQPTQAMLVFPACAATLSQITLFDQRKHGIKYRFNAHIARIDSDCIIRGF